MTPEAQPLVTNAEDVAVTAIQLPGATANGIEARLLNIDAARGMIATIIHIEAGAVIPAHFHESGSEAHYVLEGDLVEVGRIFGPGTYLTHAAGVVHGPHTSVHGCKVLTIQDASISAGSSDFHIVEREVPNDGAPGGERPASSEPEVFPDATDESVPGSTVPETQRAAPTDDNPTNPTSS